MRKDEYRVQIILNNNPLVWGDNFDEFNNLETWVSANSPNSAIALAVLEFDIKTDQIREARANQNNNRQGYYVSPAVIETKLTEIYKVLDFSDLTKSEKSEVLSTYDYREKDILFCDNYVIFRNTVVNLSADVLRFNSTIPTEALLFFDGYIPDGSVDIFVEFLGDNYGDFEYVRLKIS